MKAIFYSRYGGPEVLEYGDVPEPKLARGEVLMRVKAAGVNHIDIHCRKGVYGAKFTFPHIPGTDGAGVVESAGEGVTNVRVGDRIVMNPGISCGECERCRAGETSLCHKFIDIGREIDGTYAQFVKIPARNAIPLPSHIPFEDAAAFPLVYLTAWSMVEKANVRTGDQVLVMGAGSGVSMAAIQILKLKGAKVYTTASTEDKAERAKRLLGVDHVILYTKTPIDVEMRRLTEKRGVDAVLDHVGGDQWVPLLRSLRNGGTLVTCGATAGYAPSEDLRQIFYRQLRILGSTMGTDQELEAALGLFFSGKLKPIIDKVYPLKDAAEAHKRIESRRVFGKLILVPSD